MSKKLNIIHIDMDAFFAAIEQRDNPDLRGKPIAVGGSPKGRGVVSTASYEAREFGVHSALPASQAIKRCKNLIFLPVNMKLYKKVGSQIREIFRKYSDKIEPISIDEAFIETDNGIEVGKRIKEEIKNTLRLTASVGVSYNKFLAKLGSDYDKPNGFTVIDENFVKNVLPTLNVRKIWGVGAKMEKDLDELGIKKISDLLSFDRRLLLALYGKRAEELLMYAEGKDDRQVGTPSKSSSISEESTLRKDTYNKELLLEYLDRFSKELSERLINRYLKCRTLTIKYKTISFESRTKSHTMLESTNNYNVIFNTAKDMLYNDIQLEEAIRLIGLTASNLIDENTPEQISINSIKKLT